MDSRKIIEGGKCTDERGNSFFNNQYDDSVIQAKEKGSKLLLMVNYSLGEIEDNHRFPLDYFENI